ncbi:MAG: serine hydrolase domain-containing protein, partial [Pseudohongiellaceae bacterium]
EAIKAQMQDAVDEGFLAGALLMVGNRDGVGMLESVGYRKQGGQDPVNKDTLFRIYSMTKPIVSVAAMSMVEDGLLSLEDPVGKYIPEYLDMEVIDRETGATTPVRNTMTVRHIITHTSGVIQARFSPDSALGKMYTERLPSDGITLSQHAKLLGELPVYFEPGSAWHYGHSTNVLGAVLEAASGQTLDVILQERILGPLGMNDTSFFVPAGKAFRIAEPIYGEMPNNTVVRPLLSADGGLNSSAEDYTRFAEMLLNGGEYRGVRIIEEATLQAMLEKHITPEVSREFYFYGDRGDWGLGFHLQPTDGNNANGPHNFGWRGIGGTLFLVDRENDFYLIYMEQRMGGPGRAPFDNNAAQRVVYEAMTD